MRTIEYTIWLLREFYSFLFYFGFSGLITMPLAVAAVIAYVKSADTPGVKHRRLAIAALAPGVIPCIMLVLGVVFVHDSGDIGPMIPWFPADLVVVFIWILWFVQFAIDTALAAWAGKETGWAVFCTSLWWGWVSFLAAIVSQMSIRGDGF